ncbi:Stp1/IreP family PP2C-type Ser/Thr phosphatase [Eubacterium oxidoreducens]|uniref:Protein phosphatase n=1 Tax=Eubacterium oxidoreducens TaxID=1732 RepID=A0A1G6B629_EUBOX|nr:Stp1/IreP family PP2C-type Ser/Thr phosphatase [Eubacterium oxidoreducens]SDB16116.1 protein phosphatase [Eubacterium oxidoreducens]
MKVAARTDIGQNRDMNQDFIFVSENPVGNLPNLCVVADGMGGHNAGEYASQKTVEVMIAQLMRGGKESIKEQIRNAAYQANQTILDVAKSDQKMQGMGTTLVGVVCDGAKATVFNVGDSRMYIIRSNGISQVTEDHSLVQEMVNKGEITSADMKEHPRKNIITRAVGVQDELDVDFFDLELKEGNLLLLCSDGLSNMLKEEEIQQVVYNRKISIELRVEQLVQMANDNGGADNISVILVDPFA